MTTKITLDPALVREVLGIKEEVNIISPLAHNDKWISVSYCDGSGTTVHNIHEFKDKALEWCAGKGWGIEMRRDETDIAKGTIKVYRKLRISTICEEIFLYGDIVPRLSAELAAIDFVYKQIQKEKKDEN